MSFYYSIFLLLFFYSFNILFNIEIMKTLYYILYYSFINFNYLFTFNFIFKYLNHLKIIHFLVLKKTNFYDTKNLAKFIAKFRKQIY